jgi:hypothetical protein
VRWAPGAAPEIFFAQQGKTSGTHDAEATVEYGLNAMFIDLHGKLIDQLPFNDAQIKGYFYNGEVHSRVADVDGDGLQEIVYPKQDGRVMIIKKHI